MLRYFKKAMTIQLCVSKWPVTTQTKCGKCQEINSQNQEQRDIMAHVTDLVDVITRDGVVERTVEIIQQFNNLYRATFRRQHCESNDIREVDCHARIYLWNYRMSRLQFVSNITIWQPTYWNKTLILYSFVELCRMGFIVC